MHDTIMKDALAIMAAPRSWGRGRLHTLSELAGIALAQVTQDLDTEQFERLRTELVKTIRGGCAATEHQRTAPARPRTASHT